MLLLTYFSTFFVVYSFAFGSFFISGFSSFFFSSFFLSTPLSTVSADTSLLSFLPGAGRFFYLVSFFSGDLFYFFSFSPLTSLFIALGSILSSFFSYTLTGSALSIALTFFLSTFLSFDLLSFGSFVTLALF